MSWQAYIDDHLLATLPGGGQLTHAAILGQDGGLWASSPDFPEVSEDEVTAIMKGFDDAAALAATGLRIGGEKYMVVAGEPGEAIRGKKGPGGVTIKKTATALVFGIYDEGVTGSECNVVVENLGDYLKDQGI
ncbi:glutamate-5-semialdehyde dehydrogenase [Prototheca wickerhamii]|uniref:Profilin n=1 Tax=Prototheca wickerhamii TaxID=3111 RepID=A0AAD9INL5_PROWI|nr:glutamate-5-semialdehyde dehydrogenase [Prototheca wickerhamii]